MDTKIILRVASVLMLIHGIGHSFGHSTWTKATDPVKKAVISQMTGPKFEFMGRIHSYGDSFNGYGYAVTLSLFFMCLLLWLLSSEKAAESIVSTKIIFLLALMLILWSTDEFIYFFNFAAFTSLISGLLAFYAGYKRYRSAPNPRSDQFDRTLVVHN